MIKNLIKQIVPLGLWQQAKKVVFFSKTYDDIDIGYEGKSISHIFNEIYQDGKWADVHEGELKKGSKFYSGPGSYNEAAERYVHFLDSYIKTNNVKSVTDIGCGDFNIGLQIVKLNPTISYYGVDVVEALIDHHNEKFGNENVRFYCLDTLKEPVPQADLLVMRQVLQHLANKDILALTKNCFLGFKNILVTEHQLKPQFLVKKNIDKETGPNIRLGFGSGVYLDSPPYNYAWTEQLVVEDPTDDHCQLVTYKIESVD